LGPRRAKGQRGAVAGAMAPAMAAVKGLSFGRAGPGNALRFPRPRGTLPPGPVPPTPTETSARPGGREAPAGGGAGTGRGLWAPGWRAGSVSTWQGRWPQPDHADPAARLPVFRSAALAGGTYQHPDTARPVAPRGNGGRPACAVPRHSGGSVDGRCCAAACVLCQPAGAAAQQPPSVHRCAAFRAAAGHEGLQRLFYARI
jgi:hypothetical protein